MEGGGGETMIKGQGYLELIISMSFNKILTWMWSRKELKAKDDHPTELLLLFILVKSSTSKKKKLV